MVYATGGLAVTDVNFQLVFKDTFATAHESSGAKKTVFGWTAGAGAEFKLAGGWSLKAEYLYADFGNVSASSSNLTAFTPPIPAHDHYIPSLDRYPDAPLTRRRQFSFLAQLSLLEGVKGS
jgi:opacity protein-like surface antigen